MTPPPPTRSYYVGLDLGQAADYSALVVLETADEKPPRTFAGRHLQRWPLRTAYPTIAREVAGLVEAIAHQPGRAQVCLAVDATGVGRAVVDMLRRELRPVVRLLDGTWGRAMLERLQGEPLPLVRLMPILITGGDAVTQDDGCWRVPKRDLVGVVQVVLQTGRLKIAAALPEAQTLTHELTHFQLKLTATGHDTYGAWREGSHDDLVLALACALWAGERKVPRFRPIGT